MRTYYIKELVQGHSSMFWLEIVKKFKTTQEARNYILDIKRIRMEQGKPLGVFKVHYRYVN